MPNYQRIYQSPESGIEHFQSQNDMVSSEASSVFGVIVSFL